MSTRKINHKSQNGVLNSRLYAKGLISIRPKAICLFRQRGIKFLLTAICLLACWNSILTGESQAQGAQWCSIQRFSPLINGIPGANYNANDVVSVRCGGSGVNPLTVPLRIVLIQTIKSPGPTVTILAQKTRTIVVAPGAPFVFPVEPIDPGYNVGMTPPQLLLCEATLHGEEIGPNPTAIIGDSESAIVELN